MHTDLLAQKAMCARVRMPGARLQALPMQAAQRRSVHTMRVRAGEHSPVCVFDAVPMPSPRLHKAWYILDTRPVRCGEAAMS